MQFKGFDYDVYVIAELSGRELLHLRKLSRAHYDATCRSIDEVGGFLYGFIQCWITASENNDYSDLTLARKDVDRAVEYQLDGRELGLLGKICEMIHEPNPELTSFDFLDLLARRSTEYERIRDAAPNPTV